MKKASESAVDRLIAMALEKAPAKSEPGPGPEPESASASASEPAQTAAQMEIEAVPLFPDEALPSARELEHNPMWKALLQLRAFLPYIARMLEMSSPSQANHALSNEVRHSVSELQGSNRELRLAVQDQTLHMKRIEEAMVRTHEASERNASDLTDLAEDVKSIHSLVKRVTALLVLLLLALIGLVAFLLVRIPHLLH